MTEFITESEAKAKAKDNATPINDLINPSDIEDNAEEWSDIDDETLEMELVESAEIILSESQQPFDSIVFDLAITFLQDDLTRAPMEDLAFDSMEKAVEKGYWPYSMDKWECREILEEMAQNHNWYWDCHSEAYNVVFGGIVEGMEPEE